MTPHNSTATEARSEPEPQTLPTLLDQLIAKRGDETFLVHRVDSWSAREFALACRRLAVQFAERGLGAGDRVVVYLEKCLEKAAAVFAAGELGAIAVIANPRLKSHQLKFICNDTEARLLFTASDKRIVLGDFAGLNEGREVLLRDDLALLPADLSDLAAPPLSIACVDSAAAAVILYTSGSTGMPKGIVQTHKNLCDGARIVANYLGLAATDRLLAVMPLSFDYGLNQLLGAAYAGAQLSLLQYLAVGEVCRAIREQSITVMAAVPTLWLDFIAILEQGRDAAAEMSSLRLATNTGGRLPELVSDGFARHLPAVAFFSMYGLTEAFRSTYLPPEELAERATSIGKAIAEVELLVVDPQTGAVLSTESTGELVHCGALVAAGYWKRPVDTARVFRPHPVLGTAGGMAVFSGDLVRRDAEGYLYFVARGDQQIKVSGYRISPDEVSGVLLQVLGVRDAVVFGSEDGARGQRITACLAAAKGLEAELRRHCRRALPAYMQPAVYHFFDSLPQGPNRKIDIAALRQAIT